MKNETPAKGLNKVKKPINPTTGEELAKPEDLTGKQIAIVDTTTGNLPDLDSMAVLPVDLVGVYWTPENVGEFKRVVFTGIEKQMFASLENPDIEVEKEVAVFQENLNGAWTRVSNASSRLVSAIRSKPVNTCFIITYNGKKKNQTNAFLSDTWSVKYLMA